MSIRITAHDTFCCPNILGTPYYLRNGQSYRFQIWPVHSEGPSEQKPIKNFRQKGASWAYPGTAQFFRVPLLSQERAKLQISNLAGTFRGSIRIKAHEKFWKKGSVGVSRDCPIFSGTPIISGTGKAADFKFRMHIYGLNRNKSPLKFVKGSRGRCQGLLKICRAPMIHRAHRAVIFAIAQLSCLINCHAAAYCSRIINL